MNPLRHIADRLSIPVSTLVLITINAFGAIINLAFFIWGSHFWFNLAAGLLCASCAVIIYRLGRQTWAYRQETKYWEDRLAEIRRES